MDGQESPGIVVSERSRDHVEKASDYASGDNHDEELEADAAMSSGSSGSSVSPNSDAEQEETITFPAYQLQKLNDGLNRGSWIVHIDCLVECQRVAAALIKSPDRGALQALESTRNFIRGSLTEGFEKVLLDPAIKGWPQHLQLQIFEAVIGLMDLTVAKLSKFNHAPGFGATQTVEDELDLIALLEPLMHAFDAKCLFNLQNSECFLPKQSRAVPGRYASPCTPQASTSWRPSFADTDVEIPAQYNTFSWPAYFVNYFGHRQGFHYFRQALANPNQISVELLKHVLMTVLACLPVATDCLINTFETEFEGVLAFIEDATEEGIEQLSECGSDRMFQNLSAVFRTLFGLMSRSQSTTQAQEMVSGVQCKFVQQMLNFSNFSKHLSAVRETNAIVKRAVDLSSADHGAAMAVIKKWLHHQNIVGQLLRTNLHQKQYVDQVQKVLKHLVLEGSLDHGHIALLWDLTEKPDTFEAVRINVFNMLAELAQLFNEEQLDFLFKRIESSAARCISDSKQGMLLLFKLAKVDVQGIMTKRILGLLWRISLAAPTSGGLDMTVCFADVLRDYALNSTSLDTRDLALDYVSQLVQELHSAEKALPSLRVLRHLVSGSNSQAAAFMSVLKCHGDMLQLVLESLQRFMASSSQLRKGKHQSLGAWQNCHVIAVDCYSSFLLDLAERLYDEPLTWPFVKGLWEALMEGALLQHDKDVAFEWFYSVLLDDCSMSGAPKHSWAIIDKRSSQLLLTEKMAKLDPSTLSEAGYQCFASYFTALAADKQMSADPGMELDVPGIDFLWRIVLDRPLQANEDQTTTQPVACASQNLLIKLYQRRSTEAPVNPVLCEHFITSCVRNLVAAADGICSGDSEAKHLSAQRAARCMQLLQDMIMTCKGRTMPSKAAHAASYCGSPLSVGVTAPNIHQAKYQLDMNKNSYIGQLRQEIAAKPAFNIPPARLRMFLGGKELLNDALLLHEAGFTPDQCVVNVMGVTISNSYSSPDPEVLARQEAGLPALLLAQGHPNVYAVLLELADSCSMAAVRANAVQLLNSLPTHSQVLGSLRTALQGKQPAHEMSSLLRYCPVDEAAGLAPARLLYNLQALSALIQPQIRVVQAAPVSPNLMDEAQHKAVCDVNNIEGPKEVLATTAEKSQGLSSEALQQIVLQTGVIDAVLQAVEDSAVRCMSDIAITRSLYDIAHDMAYRLVFSHVDDANPPSLAGAAQADASTSAMPALPMSIQNDVPATVSTDSGTLSSDTGTCASQAPTSSSALPPNTPDNTAVLLKILFFVLHEAYRAARGWEHVLSNHTGKDTDEANVLPEADVAMVARAIAASWEILIKNHALLLLPFLQSSDSRVVLISILFSEHHDNCRDMCAHFLQRLSLLNSISHQWVLQLLSDNMAEADFKPRCCSEYFRQFAWTVQGLPKQAEMVQHTELQIAEKLLTDLVAVLPHLTTNDELDMRMQGKLELLLQLTQVLGLRCVASTDSQQLLRILLTEYLFPEAHVKHKYSSLQDVPAKQLHAALVPRCSSPPSRLAALRLLRELTLHSSINLQTTLELVRQLHLSGQDSASLDTLPVYALRAPLSDFVGLKNGGATCYMNAVFQQLFMQPSIRKLLLAVPELCDDQTDNIFYQMQTMFANLALTNQEFFVPSCFWNAFKDYDGQRLNLREHQDAYEFFTRLQDTADQYLRDRRLDPVLQAVIGGKFAQQIICKGVPYQSEKEEEFYQLSLDVRGKNTLEESLDLYVQGELMEGDNQYLCEEAGKKVDAIKRSCIKSLPHTLVIHLKRFEFDYETMTRWKIKDRFQFPQHLNMYKYTVEGLAEAEQEEYIQADASSSPDTNLKLDKQSQKQYEFDLKGVVVHSGTAFAGHYYSYIKARAGDGCPASSGKWFCFDDVNVEAWDIGNLEVDCFGGKYTLNSQHFKGPQQEYDRPNSAYMLFYERSEAMEPVNQIVSLTSAAHSQSRDTSAKTQQTGPLQSTGPLQTDLQQLNPPQQDWPPQRDATGMLEKSIVQPQIFNLNPEGSPQDWDHPAPAVISPEPSTPVLSQSSSSPSRTPNCLAPLADVSPLKGVSNLALGQEAVKEATDQDMVQPTLCTAVGPCSTVSLPNSMPAHIYEGVMISNLQLLRETHLMDRDYFKLIVTLVKGSSEVCNHKIRRTGTKGEDQELVDPAMGTSGLSRRAEDSNSMAVLAAEVAILFLFKIYLRVPLHAREDLADWRSVLQNIMESSAAATHLVLVTLAHSGVHRRHFVLEDSILVNTDEVRQFASGLVADALKIAVMFHGGAVDPSVDDPDPDSMSAAVSNMTNALVQAGHDVLHDDRAFDQASFAQMMLLLRDYGRLGSLQRQHLANVPQLYEFAAEVVHAYPSNVQIAELRPPVLLLAMLMRIIDLSTLLTAGRVSAGNPYKLDDAFSSELLTPGVMDIIQHMCRVELFAEPTVREALQYLSWENSALSVKVLDAVFSVCKKADAQALYQLAPYYAALVGLKDSLQQARLGYFLVARRAHQDNGPGMASLLQPARASRQPWRRLAHFRLVYLCCRDSPETVAKLVKTFPGILSTQNITTTYHALAPDNVSAIVMDEIRDFLQELIELEAGQGEDPEGKQDEAV